MSTPRVVSLLPSATESVVALGLQSRLVGCSHECRGISTDTDQLPILTGSRTRYDAQTATASSDIDHAVRTALDAGESLYTLDAEALERLEPDVILTQDLCDVCSIDLERVRSVAASLPNPPRIVALNPTTFEAVLDDLMTIADALGEPDRATQTLAVLRERMWRAQEHVNPYASDAGIVGFMEWTDPIYVAGHWNVQLIERAGGRHPWNETIAKPDAGAAAGPQQGERIAGKSIAVKNEVFAALDPDRIIIAPCGLTLDDARTEAHNLLSQGWFADMRAVQGGSGGRAGRVAIVDGNRMFNRPGPSLVDAFEFLVGFLNDRPELIPPGFPWEPLDVRRSPR